MFQFTLKLLQFTSGYYSSPPFVGMSENNIFNDAFPNLAILYIKMWLKMSREKEKYSQYKYRMGERILEYKFTTAAFFLSSSPNSFYKPFHWS